MGNKTIITIGLWLFSLLVMSGQGIPIQLMVVDSDGFEKVNHNVKLRLTLTNDTSNTTGQYQEVHLTQTNDFGILSESLGGGVVTTNSSIYALTEFEFNSSEPMIKIELDTAALSNQYYSIGYINYHYSMLARRALRADSSDFSDTAEFSRNFIESYDGDTSAMNEIQSLDYNSETSELSISSGNKIALITKNDFDMGKLSKLSSSNINHQDISFWQYSGLDSLYGWKSNGSNFEYYIGSLLNLYNIDTMYSDFKIRQINLKDSVLVGESILDSRWVIISDLYLNKIDSLFLGTNVYSNGNVSYRDGILSAHVYQNQYTHYFRNLKLSDGSEYSVNVSGSIPFVLHKHFILRWTNQYFSITDRYDGTITWNSTNQGLSNVQTNSLLIDTSGTRLAAVTDYNGSTYRGYSASGSEIIFTPENALSFIVGENSSAFLNTHNDETYLGIINLSNINSDEEVLITFLHEYKSKFADSKGDIKVVPSKDSFVVIVNNVNRFFIQGQEINGSAIYRLSL